MDLGPIAPGQGRSQDFKTVWANLTRTSSKTANTNPLRTRTEQVDPIRDQIQTKREGNPPPPTPPTPTPTDCALKEKESDLNTSGTINDERHRPKKKPPQKLGTKEQAPKINKRRMTARPKARATTTLQPDEQREMGFFSSSAWGAF